MKHLKILVVIGLSLLFVSSWRAAFAFQDFTEETIDDISPLQIQMSLDTDPQLDQEIQLTATVTATWDMVAQALIELPKDIEVVNGSLAWQGRLAAHQPASFQATIRFKSMGQWEFKASTRSLAAEMLQNTDDPIWSDVAYLYLHIDSKGGHQGLRLVDGYNNKVAVARQVGTGEEPVTDDETSAYQQDDSQHDSFVSEDLSNLAPEPPALDPLSGQISQEGDTVNTPQGSLVVKGRWMFYNRNDSLVAQQDNLVQLVRGDNNSHLAFAYTNSSGYFTFPSVTNPGSAGVKVRVYTYVKWAPNSYELMMVSPGGNGWENTYWGETSRYVFADGTRDVGTWYMLKPASSPSNKAWWGQADLRQAFLYVPDQPGGGKVEWSPTSTDGTYYQWGENIHLAGADLDVPHVLMHEYGHNIMYNIYGNYMPRNDCPSPHYVNKYSGSDCGWTEGWADFFALAVLNDNLFRWPGGGSINLETATWFSSNWDNGSGVEGRVAGTLLDIKDSAGDGYDKYSDGFSRIWSTIYNQNDDTFDQFWSAWQSRGYNKRTFQAAAFQNTIEYGYRPRFELTWGASPPDLDNHLWLPSNNKSHVYFGNKGSLTAFPFAQLDVDDTNGYGPEKITISQPYSGTYVVVANRPAGNIAGSGAVMRYYLGSYLVASWSVPTSGTGNWWYVADLNGSNGNYTTRNSIRSATPAPYRVRDTNNNKTPG